MKGPLGGPFSWADGLLVSNLQAWPEALAEVVIVGTKLCFRAENGAVVPVGIISNIPQTESIAVLIEKNPNMLAAVFDIPAGTEPSISTRVKMGQSSNIYALVKADGKYFVAAKDVKVTIGGCGG